MTLRVDYRHVLDQNILMELDITFLKCHLNRLYSQKKTIFLIFVSEVC